MNPDDIIFTILTRHAVPFVVIGGQAVIEHGYVRVTEDTDLVFRRSDATEAALLVALRELNASWVSAEKDPATGVERLVPVSAAHVATQHLMMLHTDAGFLDLFDYIPGFPDESVDSLFADAEVRHGVRFASLPWLRRMKEVAGRPKDLDDLANLTPP